MISQVISSQLQMHNIKHSQSVRAKVNIDDDDEYADDFEGDGAR